MVTSSYGITPRRTFASSNAFPSIGVARHDEAARAPINLSTLCRVTIGGREDDRVAVRVA